MKILRSEIGRALLVLVALLAFRAVHIAGWTNRASAKVLWALSSRELNKEALEVQTAGYYEGLIGESARVSAMNRLVTGSRRITFEDRSQPDRRETHDFRFYELIPNSDIPDYSDNRQRYRLKTNSAGFADREYSLEKPSGVRRIALMGDSITRGQGAPFQGTFEAQLEDKLNAGRAGGAPSKIEILNFAVGSYNVTQMMETAKVKAAPYDADVYVLALTTLSVHRSWAQHIALLMNAGIDLKYDYLRNVVRQAAIKPDDPIGVFQAKIARFRMPTIKWALGEVQALAAAHHAQVLVILVPAVEELEVVEEEFAGVREAVRERGIPLIDLLHTFADVDLAMYRVGERDTHPNALGHRLLFERLYNAISEDPAMGRLIVGSP